MSLAVNWLLTSMLSNLTTIIKNGQSELFSFLSKKKTTKVAFTKRSRRGVHFVNFVKAGLNLKMITFVQ